MVTIYDIAKKTGYSPTTVSKALNNYTDISNKAKREILKAAEAMGYLPNSHARALTTKKSWTIGVLFVEALGIGIRHPFFNAVLEGFKREAEAKGYDLMFISKDIGERKISYLDHCRFRGVDGVIIVRSDYFDEEVIEIMNSEIPSVVIDLETEKTNTIFSDNMSGSYLAVEYLHSLGHRKIAHISGDVSSFAGKKRKEGYECAIAKLGLQKREDFIVSGGYYTFDGGYSAMQKLLDLEDRPTAVFAAGDLMAVGAIKAIKERRLHVPKDISVIGFDDIDLAKYVSPALTTIRQNTNLLGGKAAKVLIDEIENHVESQTIIIPVELIVRDSCDSFRG